MSPSHFKKFIDVTVPLKNGMVHWPSDPAVKIKAVKSLAKGHDCNVSLIHVATHSGTHMDAPFHFIAKGKTLDLMPFDITVGPCRVIKICDQESIKVDELKQHNIKPQERILFKTVNSSRCWKSNKFFSDFVYISNEAARYLGKLKVRLVGVDYLSVGGYKKGGRETHLALLKAGIWIIEGLNLAKINPGKYELICLPLKIAKSDGAPARVILRK